MHLYPTNCSNTFTFFVRSNKDKVAYDFSNPNNSATLTTFLCIIDKSFSSIPIKLIYQNKLKIFQYVYKI